MFVTRHHAPGIGVVGSGHDCSSVLQQKGKKKELEGVRIRVQGPIVVVVENTLWWSKKRAVVKDA